MLQRVKVHNPSRILNPLGSRSMFRHERLQPPGHFDPRSFRTVIQGGRRVVIGCPTGQYSPTRRLCKVGTRAQAILHPRNPRARRYFYSPEGEGQTGGYIARTPAGYKSIRRHAKKTSKPVSWLKKIYGPGYISNPRHKYTLLKEGSFTTLRTKRSAEKARRRAILRGDKVWGIREDTGPMVASYGKAGYLYRPNSVRFFHRSNRKAERFHLATHPARERVFGELYYRGEPVRKSIRRYHKKQLKRGFRKNQALVPYLVASDVFNKLYGKSKRAVKGALDNPLYELKYYTDSGRVVTKTYHAKDWDKAKEKARSKRLAGQRQVKTLKTLNSRLTVPEKHQLKIAKATLKMSDVGALIMGGPTKKEAREIIARLAAKTRKNGNPHLAVLAGLNPRKGKTSMNPRRSKRRDALGRFLKTKAKRVRRRTRRNPPKVKYRVRNVVKIKYRTRRVTKMASPRKRHNPRRRRRHNEPARRRRLTRATNPHRRYSRRRRNEPARRRRHTRRNPSMRGLLGPTDFKRLAKVAGGAFLGSKAAGLIPNLIFKDAMDSNTNTIVKLAVGVLGTGLVWRMDPDFGLGFGVGAFASLTDQLFNWLWGIQTKYTGISGLSEYVHPGYKLETPGWTPSLPAAAAATAGLSLNPLVKRTM